MKKLKLAIIRMQFPFAAEARRNCGHYVGQEEKLQIFIFVVAHHQ
jgi:hypothetical protein